MGSCQGNPDREEYNVDSDYEFESDNEYRRYPTHKKDLYVGMVGVQGPPQMDFRPGDSYQKPAPGSGYQTPVGGPNVKQAPGPPPIPNPPCGRETNNTVPDCRAVKVGEEPVTIPCQVMEWKLQCRWTPVVKQKPCTVNIPKYKAVCSPGPAPQPPPIRVKHLWSKRLKCGIRDVTTSTGITIWTRERRSRPSPLVTLELLACGTVIKGRKSDKDALPTKRRRWIRAAVTVQRRN